MKKALITGITGQDGSYLAELLLEKGYEVHGLVRRASSDNKQRIEHLISDVHESTNQLKLHYGDMTDSTSLLRVMDKIAPDEVYNLAAQSHVHVSFDSPEYTANADAIGTLRLLESIKTLGLNQKTRFYQASTSELFGLIQDPIQNEQTPFYPRSPYAVAKLYAYWITVNYREAYEMYACNGILFNHESKRRGKTFVTRKITNTIARIINRKQKCLYLGNLNAQRDWGHAKDYVYMQWLMLQGEQPKDYVISTGETYSVKYFLECALNLLGIVIEWSGEGINEIGTVKKIVTPEIDLKLETDFLLGSVIIKVDPYFFRPTEVDLLLGDSKKARKDLGWMPKISFEEMVEEMLLYDLGIEAQ